MQLRGPSPASVQRAERYLTELESAIEFTRSLSCTTRQNFNPASPVVTADFSKIIREWARLNITPRAEKQIAGRCLEITFALVEFLAGAGIDSMYTLGWMSFGGKPAYHFTPDDVRRWMDGRGINRGKIDMHAWVTLLSGEIIDASWLSTVGIVRHQRHLIGAVIITDPAQPASHRYHPVTIDTAILARLGLVGQDPGTFRAQQSPPPMALAIA